MEKHSVLEKDFLKEKEQDALSFQARYRELQVSRKHVSFPDMRSECTTRHREWSPTLVWGELDAAFSVVMAFCDADIRSLIPW